MFNLIPKYVFNRITDITPEMVKKWGQRLSPLTLTIQLYMTAAIACLRGAAEWIEYEESGDTAFIISIHIAPLKDYFQRLGIMAIGKAGKAEARQFKKAAEMLGINVSELIMIGDKLDKDIAERTPQSHFRLCKSPL